MQCNQKTNKECGQHDKLCIKTMAKTKCVSVRLEDMVEISEKAYKAYAYDGTTAIIPKNQVYGEDGGTFKSRAWWIAEWILQGKGLTYSAKKVAWFDRETRKRLPDIQVYKHHPEHVAPVDNEIESLKK